MGFCEPKDVSLFGGIVSQDHLNDMEINPKKDFSAMDVVNTRESSVSRADQSQSPWPDSMETIETATAGTTPQTAPDGIECEGKNSHHDLICDTCFGMVRIDSLASTSHTCICRCADNRHQMLVDTLQIRHGFIKDSNPVGKGVLLEVYGHVITIRDPESKSYGGLIAQNHFDPLRNLITETTVTLSATLKSTTALEVLIYGCRAKAAEIGEMLLDHDCFLQQPDSFDDSMTYFNPQCLTRADDDDSMPTWEPDQAGLDTPLANLSAVQKSKVVELLDSASGPAVFRDVQISEMLQTSLKQWVHAP